MYLLEGGTEVVVDQYLLVRKRSLVPRPPQT